MTLHVLNDVDVRMIRDMKRKLDRIVGPGVTNGPRGLTVLGATPRRLPIPSIANRVALMIVTAIGNDYLTCNFYDGTAQGTQTILVAKPWELRHAATWYAEATGITTVDAQTVTASGADPNETWKVTPDYIADTTRIVAMQIASTGVTVDGAELSWIDLNVAGRAWAVD